MSGVSLADAVRGYAKAHGVEMSADQVEAADQVLRTFARIDGDTITFEADGKASTFAELMAGQTAHLPKVKQPATAKAPNLPARPDGIGRLRAGLDAARAAASKAKVAEIVAAGNPWTKGRENRTAQAVISKSKPELAKQLKAEAGVVEPGKYNWN